MSKPIKSYPESERPGVIARRATSGTGGLGELSAKEAQVKIAARKKAEGETLVQQVEKAQASKQKEE